MEDLFDDFIGELVRPFLADGLFPYQTVQAFFVVPAFPSIKCCSSNSEVPAGKADIPATLCMFENTLSSIDFSLFWGHETAS